MVCAKTNNRKVSCPVWKKSSDAAVTFRQQLLRLSPRRPCMRAQCFQGRAHACKCSALRQIHLQSSHTIKYNTQTSIEVVLLPSRVCFRCTLTASLWSLQRKIKCKSSVSTYLQLTKSNQAAACYSCFVTCDLSVTLVGRFPGWQTFCYSSQSRCSPEKATPLVTEPCS